MAGILVLAEAAEGALESITGELLAAGRSLAESLDEEVAVALLGENLEEMAGEAIALGADKVYLVEDTLLAEPQLDARLAALEGVCRQSEPSVVLIGRTSAGSDIGPRLGFRLGVAVAQDCLAVGVDAESKRVTAVRPVYGGNAMAKVTFPDADPQVVIIREKVFDPREPDPSRNGEVTAVEVEIDPSAIRMNLIETVQRDSKGVRLQDASLVVSGGRGLGGPDGINMVEELARLLGGAVGASRAVCDAGWMDHNAQVGLTGKAIAPNLYITVGISGASQHMAGCSGAKHIVAINRDPEANIFRVSSFGVVGDWRKVLPSFMETVRGLLNS